MGAPELQAVQPTGLNPRRSRSLPALTKDARFVLLQVLPRLGAGGGRALSARADGQRAAAAGGVCRIGRPRGGPRCPRVAALGVSRGHPDGGVPRGRLPAGRRRPVRRVQPRERDARVRRRVRCCHDCRVCTSCAHGQVQGSNFFWGACCWRAGLPASARAAARRATRQPPVWCSRPPPAARHTRCAGSGPVLKSMPLCRYATMSLRRYAATPLCRYAPLRHYAVGRVRAH